MSWLDKIKGIVAEKENKVEVETPARAINFEDIPLLLEERTGKISKKEAEIKTRIINRIKKLGENLNGGINALRNVDLNKRKEEERLKLIVRENSNMYISLVLRLSSKLGEICENKERKGGGEIETKILLEDIAANLNKFYRASITPFQKSTILIGQEMENLKMIIKGFSDGMIIIEKENESFFREYESVKILNSYSSELKELEKQEKNLIYLLEEQKKKDIDIKKSLDGIEKEIDNCRKSEDYKKDIGERENKQKEKRETERKIQELKMNIDFKELSKKYHSIEKMHEIVKRYSSSFTLALMEDKELEFEKLLINEDQKELLRELKNKLIESTGEFITKTGEKIKSLEDMQQNIKNELKTIESDIEIINRKENKLTNQKDKIKEEIKYLAERIL